MTITRINVTNLRLFCIFIEEKNSGLIVCNLHSGFESSPRITLYSTTENKNWVPGAVIPVIPVFTANCNVALLLASG